MLTFLVTAGESAAPLPPPPKATRLGLPVVHGTGNAVPRAAGPNVVFA
jgi:hypothetical protein